MSRIGWHLELMPSARRDLNKLPEAPAAAVLEALQHIAQDPKRIGKPLKLELEGLWSARRGSYRIIYRIDESAHRIAVVAIDHRSDIYGRGRRGRAT